MSHKKNRNDPDDPKPLNFDHDEETGPSDRLKEPFMTPDEKGVENEIDKF